MLTGSSFQMVRLICNFGSQIDSSYQILGDQVCMNEFLYDKADHSNASLSANQACFDHLKFGLVWYSNSYSNHLNTGLVWYSNGRFVSSIWIVLQITRFYYLNTRHPYCPVFWWWLLYSSFISWSDWVTYIWTGTLE